MRYGRLRRCNDIPSLRIRRSRVLVAVAIAAAGCSDGPTTAPEAGPSGFVSVHTVTSGRWIPEGGLQVWVDHDPRSVTPIGLNGSTVFTIRAGEHEIELFRGKGESFFPACSVEGGMTRSVEVESGQSTLVEYELYCEVTLVLTATTAGPNPDLDGFRLLVGPGFVIDPDLHFDVRHLSADEPLVLDRNSSYWWWERSPQTWIYIWDIAPNCTLLDANPLTLETGGGVTERHLTVDCVDPSPSTGTVYYRDQGLQQVFRVEADGSGLAKVTADSLRVRDWALSPDRTELVFSPWGDGGLFRVRVDGSGLERIAPDDWSYDSHLSWGADGRILFQQSDSLTYRPSVYSMRPDGTDRRQLRSEEGREPALSPDGTTIVFQGAGGLSTMDTDGSHVVVILPDVELASPKWSPDGLLIAGATSDGIVVVDPATAAVVPLTSLPLQYTYDFAWSPAGDRLGYAAIQGGIDYPVDYEHAGDLFTVSIAGRNLERLTTLNIRAGDLDWRD